MSSLTPLHPDNRRWMNSLSFDEDERRQRAREADGNRHLVKNVLIFLVLLLWQFFQLQWVKASVLSKCLTPLAKRLKVNLNTCMAHCAICYTPPGNQMSHEPLGQTVNIQIELFFRSNLEVLLSCPRADIMDLLGAIAIPHTDKQGWRSEQVLLSKMKFLNAKKTQPKWF